MRVGAGAMDGRFAQVGGFLLAGCLTLGCAVFCAASAVEDDDFTRASLQGLPGVYVAVQALSPDMENAGLSPALLRADTEMKLRMAGIRVLSREEWAKTTGGPVCYLEVDIVNDLFSSGMLDFSLYAYNVKVELNQDVVLLRDPSVRSLSPTWSCSYLGVTNSVPRIRDKAKEMVARFVEAYLAANPGTNPLKEPDLPGSDVLDQDTEPHGDSNEDGQKESGVDSQYPPGQPAQGVDSQEAQAR